MVKIIGIILSLVFSGITTFSFFASNKCLKNVLVTESIGQAAVIIAVIMTLLHFDTVFIILMCLGIVLIIASCILNGFNMYGHVHISHHIVRIILCAVIIVLCVLGMGK